MLLFKMAVGTNFPASCSRPFSFIVLLLNGKHNEHSTYVLRLFMHPLRVIVWNVGRLSLKVAPAMSNKQWFYAVGRGRNTGVYNSWQDCVKQVHGIRNAKYRKFASLPEAEEFVEAWKNHVSPGKGIGPSASYSANRNQQTREVKKTLVSFNFCNLTQKNENQMYFNFEKPNNWQNLTSLERESENFIPLETKEGIGVVHDIRPLKDSKYLNCKYLSFLLANKKKEKVKDLCLSLSDLHRIIKNSKSKGNRRTSILNGTSSVCSSNVLINDLYNKTNQFVERKEDDSNKSDVAISKTMEKQIQPAQAGIEPSNSSLSLQSQVLNENGVEASTREDAEGEKNAQSLLVMWKAAGRTKQQFICDTTADTVDPTSEIKTESNNEGVDVVALVSRLDAFEKRFNDCLKQVGNIVAEMEQIKVEVKKIRDELGIHPQLGKQTAETMTRSFTHRTMAMQNYFKNAMEPQAMPGLSSVLSSTSLLNQIQQDKKRRRSLSSGPSSEPGSKIVALDDLVGNPETKIKKELSEDVLTFSVDEEDYVHVYTDGSCANNGQEGAKAGIGVWFGDNHPLNISEPVVGDATNNIAEIRAATVAVELAARLGIKKLKIFTDSEYLISSITYHIINWKANNWRTANHAAVKNRSELERLDAALSSISVKWEKVRGHSGIHGNEEADRLADKGAKRYVLHQTLS